jgi:hypothetical protein
MITIIKYLLLFVPTLLLGQTYYSSIIYPDSSGQLIYHADKENNYIPNFSHAGYRGGGVPLPEVSIKKIIQPISGDNTQHIQKALDEMATLPLDQKGIRGALLLKAGKYLISGTIRIKASGIVLRGEGDGEDTLKNTVLMATGNVPALRNVIEVGFSSTGTDWRQAVGGVRTKITSPFLPSGTKTIQVENSQNYKIGDTIGLYHPSTYFWLKRIDFGGPDTDEPWTVTAVDIYYLRHIVAIDRSQHKINLDVPIFDHFDREFVQTEIYKVALPGNVTEVGIENLRVDILTNGVFDEAHAKSALAFNGAENVWVKQFTGLHFYYAAVDFTRTNFATVIQSKGLEPHSTIDGERRYNFNVGAYTSNILFTQCHTTEGRHSYVSNGASTASGIVFHRCTSQGDHNSSEGHRRWSQGLLYDNIAFSKVNNQILIGLYNRGSYGTAHGWSTTSGVAWNVTSDRPTYNQAVIQKPPFHQNFAIGGNITLTGNHRFSQPPGHMEHAFKQVSPQSLYDEQLKIRLAGLETPDAPAQWKVTKNGAQGIISMEWLDVAMDETGYQIETSVDGGKSYQVLKNLPPNTTQYTMSEAGLNANTLFRVVAKGEKGWSPYTYSTTALVTTGTSNTLAQMGITLYPNPSGNILKISSATPLKIGVIYHLNGTKLKEWQWENGTDLSISLIELPQGQYFISLSSDNQKTAIGSFQKY